MEGVIHYTTAINVKITAFNPRDSIKSTTAGLIFHGFGTNTQNVI